MAEAVGLDADRIEVRDHGRTSCAAPRSIASGSVRDSASTTRRSCFLAIGFVQPHKGFDRAVRAFDGLADHGCRLDIVGSVRVDEPPYVDYARTLRGSSSRRGARTCTRGT